MMKIVCILTACISYAGAYNRCDVLELLYEEIYNHRTNFARSSDENGNPSNLYTAGNVAVYSSGTEFRTLIYNTESASMDTNHDNQIDKNYVCGVQDDTEVICTMELTVGNKVFTDRVCIWNVMSTSDLNYYYLKLLNYFNRE